MPRRQDVGGEVFERKGAPVRGGLDPPIGFVGKFEEGVP